MVQWVEHLPYKHKGLNLIPSTHIKNPGTVVCACNLSTGEVGTRGSLRLVELLVESSQ